MSPRQTKRRAVQSSECRNGFLVAEQTIQEPSVVTTIPLEKIISTQSQPRRYFDPHTMQSLTESISSEGILQPLLVKPIEGDLFELVFGERRYRAALNAGLTEVPVIVRVMSNQQALQYALVENLQREDLTSVEETDAILQLLAIRLGYDVEEVSSLLYRMDNAARGKTTQNVSGSFEAEIVEQLFAALGRMNWQSFVRTRLPLLKLPPTILEALGSKQIQYTKALEIGKLESKSEREELLEQAISQGLTVNEIRERVKAEKPPILGEEIQARMEATYKLAKKLKVWNNPEKRQKLESLLEEIEALLFEQ